MSSPPRHALPPMRLHDLRHGAATLLLAEGVDLRTIADILGHTQVSITADLYSLVSVAMKRRGTGNARRDRRLTPGWRTSWCMGATQTGKLDRS